MELPVRITEVLNPLIMESQVKVVFDRLILIER